MQKGPSARQTASGFYANMCHEEEKNAVTNQEETGYRVFTLMTLGLRRKQTRKVRVGNV